MLEMQPGGQQTGDQVSMHTVNDVSVLRQSLNFTEQYAEYYTDMPR